MKIRDKEYDLEFKTILPIYKERAALQMEDIGKALIAWGTADRIDEKKLLELGRRWASVCEEIFVKPGNAPPITEAGIRGIGEISLSFFAPDSKMSE